jgi:hypothetical protein
MKGLLGYYEAPAALATGMLSQPIAGLAGLLAMPGGPDKAANAVRTVQNALTYQPRGEVGQSQLRSLGMLTQPLANAQQAIGDAGYNAAGPIGGMLGMLAPEAALMMTPGRVGNLAKPNVLPRQAGILAYHGSPYKFDRFDMNRIGSGEGAQAYGHGLYFAENPKVANSYRASNAMASGNPEGYAAGIVGMMGSPEKGLAHLKSILPPRGQTTFSGESHDMVKAAIHAIETGGYKARGAGSLYKVDIPDEAVAKMLDWDKPLSQQPELSKLLEGIEDPVVRAWRTNGAWPHITGQVIYKHLAGGMTRGSIEAGKHAEVSAKLRSLGIPGIRYLDGGSRGQGQGTSNFVVFDDKLPQIKGIE